jgi:hypothetical protein
MKYVKVLPIMKSFSKMCCHPLLWLLAAHSSFAAIIVNGLTDRTRYDGSVTFTIVAESGFTTTATLDGQPRTVGVQDTVNTVSYHELFVSKQPNGGGSNETLSIQFIVRNPERISTEDGIPTFTPPPIVDDAPSAFVGGTLMLIVPPRVPVGLTFPLVTQLRQSDGSTLWLNGTVQTTNGSMRLLRGFGSALLQAPAGPETRNIEARVAGLFANASITFDASAWTARGGTLGGSEDWGTNARVQITNSLTIPSGAILRMGAGTIVALAAGAEVIVNGGTLEIAGTLSNPVVFTPINATEPWGGLRLTTATGSRFIGAGAIFTGSGADATWFNTHSGYSVHRREQACLLVDTGAQAYLTNCFFVRLAGQAFHLKSGVLRLTDCLVQRATTCGQINGGTFSALRCGLIEFPDTSSNFVDEDNDAIYLVPGNGNTYTVEGCVIGFTKDDGVDTGAGHIVMRRCWFENTFHEGTSPSTTTHNMEIYDSVFTHCGQGVEQGFGNTTVLMNHCATMGCMVGIRSGDNYGAPTFTDYSGVITASNCFSLFNEFQDVWGYEWNSWTYRTNRMSITNNYFTAATTRHPSNYVWNPAVDGALLSGFMPVSNSAVGVAITGARSGSIYEYQGFYDVRLSTFSARPVSVNYSLVGKTNPASLQQTTLASGTVQFAAGETRKTLNLALPGIHAFGFLHLALSQPQNAEVTSPDLLYFTTLPPPPDVVLVPRGAGNWSYQALRVEPAGAWEGLSYIETNWVQNTTAPIGFGTIGTNGTFVTLNTVLTAAEQGPSTDRTRAVYFRRHFTVPDPALVRGLTLNLMRDDGVVVYLNGKQVGRNNIDSGTTTGGTVNYSLLATRTIDNAEESTFIPMPVSTDLVQELRAGDNVIALEVHQATANSSDLVMDLELIASFHPPVEDVHGIGRESSGAPFVYWLDNRWQLEASSNLFEWLGMPQAASPWKPTLDTAQEFYRWRR